MRHILILSLVAAAACGPSQSEVEVDWTFAGASCDQAGVAFIRVDIANETLSPNQFSCAEASLGADLGTYLSGDYQITVTGMAPDGSITHQATQTIQVRGGHRNLFTIDVPLIATAPETTGSATLTWTFDGKSCAAATVDTVRILVDPDANGNGGINAGDVACSTMGTDGASVEGIDPGTHTFAIIGFRTVGGVKNTLYRTHHPAQGFIAVGATTPVTVSAESPP